MVFRRKAIIETRCCAWNFGRRVGPCVGPPICNMKKTNKFSKLNNFRGGRGGIRTHGELAPTAVFKTAALNHSATLPSRRHPSRAARRRHPAFCRVRMARSMPVCSGCFELRRLSPCPALRVCHYVRKSLVRRLHDVDRHFSSLRLRLRNFGNRAASAICGCLCLEG